ncbi:MAG TPA: hypothetical protein VF427_15850, partial [Noviherbaspirillum sp.]
MDMRSETADELDVKLLLETLRSLKKGDFSIRLPSDWTGLAGKIADTLNDIIETNAQMAEGITNASRIVGREGHLGHRASVPNVSGGWASMVNSVNTLIDDLVRPT